MLRDLLQLLLRVQVLVGGRTAVPGVAASAVQPQIGDAGGRFGMERGGGEVAVLGFVAGYIGYLVLPEKGEDLVAVVRGEPTAVPEFHCDRYSGHQFPAVTQVGEVRLAEAKPRRELEDDEPHLAGFPKRHQSFKHRLGHPLQQFGFGKVQLLLLLVDGGQNPSQMLGESSGGDVVAGEGAEGLGVKEKVLRGAAGPGIGHLDGGDLVVGTFDFNGVEAVGVVL